MGRFNRSARYAAPPKTIFSPPTVEPSLETFWGERGNRALLGDSSEELRNVAQKGKLRSQVDQPRRVRRDARPEIDIAEGVSTAWAHAAFVIMRQEFRLVGGNVHP